MLGGFDVWRDGQPVPPAEWRGHKTRDLLKILLLARGQYVSNDQLADWLWPEAAPQAAEANLRSAVSDLRRLLEPGLASGRDSAYVLTRREGYSFNLDAPVSLDLIAFEQAARGHTRAALQAALSRYRGDLLPEDLYAEWALPERDRLRGLRLDAMARLAEACLAERNWAQAISAAEQALALDSGREAVWRALMRAHYLGGDRAAALLAFDRCRTALSRDLGTDPMPETLALHQEILRGDLPGRQTGESTTPAPAVTVPPGLLRLAGVGIGLWVAATGAQLALMLAGWLTGSLVTSGDPGAAALPQLLGNPAALGQLHQQIYLFFPLGLLLLPSYLAWYAALRAAHSPAARLGQGDNLPGLAWLGAGLGLLEVVAQTLSRSISLAQVTVLPAAYANNPGERQVLITIWDLMRQLAAGLAFLSGVAHPLAIGLLSAVTLAQSRAGRPPLPRAHTLAWAGMLLAGLTLAYLFASPGPALAPWLLPFGTLLAAAHLVWLAGLAAAFWACARA
jgi:DNA-binding SARP family transcriptional activator